MGSEMCIRDRYIVGNGIFGDLFNTVSLLTPIFSVEQSIDLMPYMMNSMSFNVEIEDQNVESCFEGLDVLLTTNDDSEYFVPEFGVNTIGDVEYDMGLNTFIVGGDSQVLTMEGLPIDPALSPLTLDSYMLNLIPYILSLIHI